MRFRKKSVEIEAVQLTWETWSEVCDFVPKPWFVRGCYLNADGKEVEDGNGQLGLIMHTLESQEYIAQENDWIIQGIRGEFYPCKPDIFVMTYEPVENHATTEVERLKT